MSFYIVNAIIALTHTTQWCRVTTTNQQPAYNPIRIKGYFTGVGSRTTPEPILAIMREAGKHLCNNGWIFRSGAAQGADQGFQDGVEAAPAFNMVGMEIYLPWNGFQNYRHGAGFFDAKRFTNHKQAEAIVSQIHPAWDRLTNGPRLLHTRNVYQVLGQDLNSPSRFLICYAEPVGNRGQVKGGTNTAVQLALLNNVPVFNLYYKEAQERLLRMIE